MYVQDLASTRVTDREYTLRAEKEGERRAWSVTVTQDKKGAGTHDREIVEYTGYPTYREAQGLYLILVRTALHHEGANPFGLGNSVAREGCDRCSCGCKYWENDRCIDCGEHVSKAPKDD